MVSKTGFSKPGRELLIQYLGSLYTMPSKKNPNTNSDLYISHYSDAKFLLETINYKGAPKFAIDDGNSVKIAPYATINGKTIKPHPDPLGTMRDGGVLLATEPAPYGSTEVLLDAIQNYIHAYTDMPKFWEKLCSHYVLMAWVADLFGAVPYLRFLGDYECGKTRMWETVGQCTCRAIVVSGGSTPSPMFRMIEMYRGTLLIDEADYKSSDLDSDIIKILNVGYRRGGKVWRSEKVGDTYCPKAYDVYSPKILTNRRRFQDDAMESRCITYIAPNNRHVRADIPVQLIPNSPDNFYEQGQQIRNMCLQWRFDHWRIIMPDLNVPANLPNRYREVAVPLLTLIADEDFKTELVEMLADEGKKRKQDSDMALCVQAVHALAGAQQKGKVKAGEVAQEMKRIAEDEGNELEITGKMAGDLLRQLKFLPAPRTGRGCFYHFTRAEISDLLRQFDLK
jgi:hypothetical protein